MNSHDKTAITAGGLVLLACAASFVVGRTTKRAKVDNGVYFDRDDLKKKFEDAKKDIRALKWENDELASSKEGLEKKLAELEKVALKSSLLEDEKKQIEEKLRELERIARKHALAIKTGLGKDKLETEANLLALKTYHSIMAMQTVKAAMEGDFSGVDAVVSLDRKKVLITGFETFRHGLEAAYVPYDAPTRVSIVDGYIGIVFVAGAPNKNTLINLESLDVKKASERGEAVVFYVRDGERTFLFVKCDGIRFLLPADIEIPGIPSIEAPK